MKKVIVNPFNLVVLAIVVLTIVTTTLYTNSFVYTYRPMTIPSDVVNSMWSIVLILGVIGGLFKKADTK